MKELILILETRPSNRSDYMYVKSTLDYYYGSRSYGITPIYAKSKSQLMDQESRIKKAIKESKRFPVVILFADVDNKEEKLNENIAKYCKENDYDLVWMNLNIEDVYLGKMVETKSKAKEAFKFQLKKDSIFPTMHNLSEEEPLKHKGTSNILKILDKYLTRSNT